MSRKGRRIDRSSDYLMGGNWPSASTETRTVGRSSFFTGRPVRISIGDLFGADDTASCLGIRLIAVDRPGIGLSSFQPGRRFLDWPDDVAALAGHLGFTRFSILGYSSGGAYALACALKIPDHLARVVTISADGPYDLPGLTAGMEAGSLWFLRLSRNAPALYRWLLRGMGLAARRLPWLYQRGFQSLLPDVDRSFFARQPVRQACSDTLLEALAPGSCRRAVGYCLDGQLLGFSSGRYSNSGLALVWWRRPEHLTQHGPLPG